MSLQFPSTGPLASDRRLPEDKHKLPVAGWRRWRLRPTLEGVVLGSLFGVEGWEVGVTTPDAAAALHG